MTDEPAQLPTQQFSTTNANSRSESRLGKLEERVRQLEQGQQNLIIPSFRWEPSTSVTGSSATFDINLPLPATSRYSSVDIFYYFKINIGGTIANGTITAGDSGGAGLHSWTWTTPTGVATTFASSTGTALSVIDSSGTDEKSVLLGKRFTVSTGTTTFRIVVTRTGGAATTTVNALRFYAIIPTVFDSSW